MPLFLCPKGDLLIQVWLYLEMFALQQDFNDISLQDSLHAAFNVH